MAGTQDPSHIYDVDHTIPDTTYQAAKDATSPVASVMSAHSSKLVRAVSPNRQYPGGYKYDMMVVGCPWIVDFVPEAWGRYLTPVAGL